MEETIELNDIIRVLWKRKWTWILLPVVAAVIAFAVSQVMTPTYESQTTLVLGNFNDNVYTNQASAVELLLSAETLEPIAGSLHLQYATVKEFRESLQVEPIVDTQMLTITASHSDPQTAKAIADAVAAAFIEQSNRVYEEKSALVEASLTQLQTQYEQTGKSLDRNKEALTAIETNAELSNAEKDLSRARLLDYVVKDEDMLISLAPQIQEVQNQLLEMEDARVIEAAREPRMPVSPNPLLNTAIAVVVGAMIGVGLAFVMEYFQHNPIRLEEDEAQARDGVDRKK